MVAVMMRLAGRSVKISWCRRCGDKRMAEKTPVTLEDAVRTRPAEKSEPPYALEHPLMPQTLPRAPSAIYLVRFFEVAGAATLQRGPLPRWGLWARARVPQTGTDSSGGRHRLV